MLCRLSYSSEEKRVRWVRTGLKRNKTGNEFYGLPLCSARYPQAASYKGQNTMHKRNMGNLYTVVCTSYAYTWCAFRDSNPGPID